MMFDLETQTHLEGGVFSDDLRVRYIFEPDDFIYRSRVDLMMEMCRGKKVIHLGCVDHSIDAIERKLQRGIWLHKLLADVTERCYGIDINADGIAYMRDQLGYVDVEAIDLRSANSARVTEEYWDCVLLPEVLEHIGDPSDFLSCIHSKLSPCAARIAITVPHAFYRKNFERARNGMERINSDHRFWFTAYTLSKLMIDNGFKIEKISFCSVGDISRSGVFHRWYYKRNPASRNSLMVVACF